MPVSWNIVIKSDPYFSGFKLINEASAACKDVNKGVNLIQKLPIRKL